MSVEISINIVVLKIYSSLSVLVNLEHCLKDCSLKFWYSFIPAKIKENRKILHVCTDIVRYDLNGQSVTTDILGYKFITRVGFYRIKSSQFCQQY
jgi:hypothetical protein